MNGKDMENKMGVMTMTKEMLKQNPLLIIAIVYSISPVDFIPDVIPILGSLDDTIMLLIPMLKMFSQVLHQSGIENGVTRFVDKAAEVGDKVHGTIGSAQGKLKTVQDSADINGVSKQVKVKHKEDSSDGNNVSKGLSSMPVIEKSKVEFNEDNVKTLNSLKSNNGNKAAGDKFEDMLV